MTARVSKSLPTTSVLPIARLVRRPAGSAPQLAALAILTIATSTCASNVSRSTTTVIQKPLILCESHTRENEAGNRNPGETVDS